MRSSGNTTALSDEPPEALFAHANTILLALRCAAHAVALVARGSRQLSKRPGVAKREPSPQSDQSCRPLSAAAGMEMMQDHEWQHAHDIPG